MHDFPLVTYIVLIIQWWNLLDNKSVLLIQTSVLFLYNRGIFSGKSSLLALYLSWTPSQKTATSPPNCLYLNNHLYIDEKYGTLNIFLDENGFINSWLVQNEKSREILGKRATNTLSMFYYDLYDANMIWVIY